MKTNQGQLIGLGFSQVFLFVEENGIRYHETFMQKDNIYYRFFGCGIWERFKRVEDRLIND